MSVCGIDLGNATSLVALARKRGIDMILNSESARETPAVAGFTPTRRFVGCAGQAQVNMNVKNSVKELKRLIGRKFSDPIVQAEAARAMYPISERADGGVEVEVKYLGKATKLTPEQLLAIVMGDIKSIAEKDQGSKVTDVVLGVPVYFTDAQRRAVLDASRIAGFNCLRLMHETTATALAYGIFKTDLPEKEDTNVAFVDVGHSSMQVCVVAFRKGQLKVLSHAWDANLGGRDFDRAIATHFAKKFAAEKPGLGDVLGNNKAMLRLGKEVEKTKKILSANPEATMNVECLANDIDVRAHITREEFEEICAETLARVRAPCEKALADAGVAVDKIASLEVVGSGSRVPAICGTLQDVFKREISRTLNASECVARGCALQCAMLSPVFKVRDFDVQDVFPFPVSLSWAPAAGGEDTTVETEGSKDGAAGTAAGAEVFSAYNPTPSTKMLTFFRDETFALDARYTEAAPIGDAARELATFSVGPIPKPTTALAAGAKPKIKVKVKLNLHGVVTVEGAQMVEEEEYQVKVDPPATAAEKKEGGDAPMEDAAAAAAPEFVTKKRIKRTEVPVSTARVFGNAEATVAEWVAAEQRMKDQDTLMEETAERKNALEEYVYSMRTALGGGKYSEYMEEAGKPDFLKKLDDLEDWLYDEGEDETKAVYVAKLDELRAVTDPVVERYDEAERRPKAAAGLVAAVALFEGVAVGGEARYAHLEQEEKDTMVKECAAAKAWLEDKTAQQAGMAKTAVPVLFSHEISKKEETLRRVCGPIMDKPKPKVEAPKAAEEPAAAAADGEAPMETEGEAPPTTKGTADDLD
eukprot:PRCOL_00001620-RA